VRGGAKRPIIGGSPTGKNGKTAEKRIRGKGRVEHQIQEDSFAGIDKGDGK